MVIFGRVHLQVINKHFIRDKLNCQLVPFRLVPEKLAGPLFNPHVTWSKVHLRFEIGKLASAIDELEPAGSESDNHPVCLSSWTHGPPPWERILICENKFWPRRIIFGRRQLFDNRLPLAVIIHSPRRNFDVCDSGHLEAELKIALVGSSVELKRVVWEQLCWFFTKLEQIFICKVERPTVKSKSLKKYCKGSL